MTHAKAFCLSLALIGIFSTWSEAADKANPDWPCVQRKVPTISPAMMWSGPEISTDALKAWRNDKKVTGLVPRLAARRTDLEEADKIVTRFAAEIEQPARSGTLTLLFAGVLDRINAERRKIMDGIERFTRKQRKLSESVNKIREDLAASLRIESPSDADLKARRALEQKLTWQSRIYEERERSLRYVCESPVILEQRAFAIARSIMNHLE